MPRGSMESTCLTNASIRHSLFQEFGIYTGYCHRRPFSSGCDYRLLPLSGNVTRVLYHYAIPNRRHRRFYPYCSHPLRRRHM